MMRTDKFNVRLVNGRLEVTAPYHAPELKTIGARQSRGKWYLPGYNWALQALIRLVGGKELRVTQEVSSLQTGWGFPPLPDGFPVNFSLWETLWEYQQQLVHFLRSTPHPGALINLSPGLGKTYSTIVASSDFVKPILVVAPLTFLDGWAQEIQSALPEADVRISHQTRFSLDDYSGELTYVIANYDTVVGHPEWFTPIQWSVLIIDESVGVKSRNAKRTKQLGIVRKSVEKVWLLSGSPITRYADDLWAQFNLIDPNSFTSYWRFVDMYCRKTQTPWATKVTGNQRGIDLRKEFRDLVFTVREHEVLESAPDRFTILNAPLAKKQREAFDSMNKEMIAELETTTVEAAMTVSKLARLQQIVSNPINLDKEWLEWPSKAHVLLNGLNRQQIPTPTVVWTWFVETSEWLSNTLNQHGWKTVRIHSGLQANERAQIVNEFQEGLHDVLIIGLSIGRYGLTLNNAQSMVYYERTWDADAYIQSLARMSGGLRGVDREQKDIFILHSPETTDDLIEKNLTKKAFSITHVSQQDLLTLLKGFSKHGRPNISKKNRRV